VIAGLGAELRVDDTYETLNKHEALLMMIEAYFL